MEFTDYISECKARIRKAKPDASQEVIEWNAPFILTPKSPGLKGILLIHGLLDSPFVMRDIAKVFQERGYWVYAILLPGHGTAPHDLLTVTDQDWMNEVAYGMQALTKVCSQVSIAGYSTGAALALYYAHTHTRETLEKIYCFSPACKIKSRVVFLTGMISKLGRFIPSLRFIKILEEDDCVKYKTTAFNAAWQVYKLSQKTKGLKIPQALFLAISEQDETVSFEAALALFNRQANPANKMLVFSNRHYPSEKNISVIRSDILEKHILCLSHHGTIISPDNPQYGEHGLYTLQNQLKYHADYYGNAFEITQLPNGKRVSRLFYNPAFQGLVGFL